MLQGLSSTRTPLREARFVWQPQSEVVWVDALNACKASGALQSWDDAFSLLMTHRGYAKHAPLPNPITFTSRLWTYDLPRTLGEAQWIR